MPIPPGVAGTSVGEAHRRLHEQDVADALVDPEGAEEEPDRREAERPVERAARATTVRT